MMQVELDFADFELIADLPMDLYESQILQFKSSSQSILFKALTYHIQQVPIQSITMEFLQAVVNKLSN